MSKVVKRWQHNAVIYNPINGWTLILFWGTNGSIQEEIKKKNIRNSKTCTRLEVKTKGKVSILKNELNKIQVKYCNGTMQPNSHKSCEIMIQTVQPYLQRVQDLEHQIQPPRTEGREVNDYWFIVLFRCMFL